MHINSVMNFAKNQQTFKSLTVSNDPKTEKTLKKIWYANVKKDKQERIRKAFMKAIQDINQASKGAEYRLVTPNNDCVDFSIQNIDETVQNEQRILTLTLPNRLAPINHNDTLFDDSDGSAFVKNTIKAINDFRNRAVSYFKKKNAQTSSIADYINNQLK